MSRPGVSNLSLLSKRGSDRNPSDLASQGLVTGRASRSGHVFSELELESRDWARGRLAGASGREGRASLARDRTPPSVQTGPPRGRLPRPRLGWSGEVHKRRKTWFSGASFVRSPIFLVIACPGALSGAVPSPDLSATRLFSPVHTGPWGSGGLRLTES